MRRRTVLATTMAALGPRPLGAQPKSNKARRLGVLMGGLANDPMWRGLADVFVNSLAEDGWRDGENLQIEWRWAGGDRAEIERSAIELVASRPDAVFCQTSPATAALRRATDTIPIIFVRVTDPVGQGLVASLARPGGNVTGFTDYDAPMAGKWLAMLTQLTPPVRRVVVFYNPATAPYADLMLHAIEDAARPLAVTVQVATVDDDAGIDAIMASVARGEGSGVLALPHVFTSVHRAAVISAVARHRLPAVYAERIFVTAGGLMSYGIDPDDSFHRAASYVDRVLRGARVGELPVQDPTKFVLAINLRTASAIGIGISPTLLAAADEVID